MTAGLTEANSWASNKNYSLPIEIVQELRRVESVQELLDRYVPARKFDVNATATTTATGASKEQEKSAFMSALFKEPDTVTANNAAAYSTSDNPLVDLFFQLAPHIKNFQLYQLLDEAWSKDSLSTLRIIWQGRSIHEGKGIQDEVFYSSLAWLYQKHPRTLFENLHLLVEQECKRQDLKIKLDNDVVELVSRPSVSHGYYKDLLNFLLLALTGDLEKGVKAETIKRALHNGLDNTVVCHIFTANKKRKLSSRNARKVACEMHKQIKKLDGYHLRYHKTLSKEGKHELVVLRLKETLAKDPKFRALYILVSRLFATKLQADIPLVAQLEHTPAEQKYSISSRLTLAGKWAPTPGKSHDKQLLIATAIASIMLPDITDTVARRVTYQKTILAPLRRALDIPEVKMSAGAWSDINYNKISSRAMALHKKSFFFNDRQRFLKYLQDISDGTRKISGAILFPHEIMCEAVMSDADIDAKYSRMPPDIKEALKNAMSAVLEGQWTSMVQSLRESSSEALSNCIAVVDVSGSMGHLCSGNTAMDKKHPSPKLVAVSLGILLAQLSKPPFNRAYIGFDADPTIYRLKENARLSEIGQNMHGYGLNTDIAKVFRLLLNIATKHNLKKQDMIKKVFVFSDMDFDQADQHYVLQISTSTSSTSALPFTVTSRSAYIDTPYLSMKAEYNIAGYDLPELVYWNIRGSGAGQGSLPVQVDEPGVELMSGFSASLMKIFLGQAEAEAEAEAEVEETKAKVNSKDEDEFDFVDVPVEGKEEEEEEEETLKANTADKLRKVLKNPAFAKLRVVD